MSFDLVFCWLRAFLRALRVRGALRRSTHLAADLRI